MRSCTHPNLVNNPHPWEILLYNCMHAQSFLTLCGPVDCTLPGSSKTPYQILLDKRALTQLCWHPDLELLAFRTMRNKLTLFISFKKKIFLGGDTFSQGLLYLPLPGKIIKLSFSTSPKTLPLRFNSPLGYREAELSASLPGTIPREKTKETGKASQISYQKT